MTQVNRIREIRLNQGMTMKELAQRAGISAAYLSDIERGNRNGKRQTLCRIANGLGVMLSELFEKAV